MPDFIMDSRMAWHFVHGALRVFLSVSRETAARRIMADAARQEATSLQRSGKAGVEQAERFDRLASSLESGGPVEGVARSHPSWVLGRDAAAHSSWSRLFE